MNKPIEDNFRGDNAHLRHSIKAMIEMSDDDCLVPHGLSGHARALMAAAYHRIPVKEAPDRTRRFRIGSLFAGIATVVYGILSNRKSD